MHSDTRRRFEELAAGLVLGNLDAKEFQELQQAMAAQSITTEDLVALIQLENHLQEGSEFQEATPPPAGLRSQILKAATTNRTRRGSDDRLKQPRRPSFWPLALGGCAVASAIGLAINNGSLRQQLARAERQQALWEGVATQPSSSDTTAKTASPSLPLALVATTQQVFDDHLAALGRDRGPADFPSNRLDAVWEHFRSAGVLSSPPPSLAVKEAELLGGSPCWFKAAQGVRFNYALQEDKTVSFYQLKPSSAAKLTGKAGPVYVNSADGTNMVLWSDENVLYAIVGSLPFPALQRLASAPI